MSLVTWPRLEKSYKGKLTSSQQCLADLYAVHLTQLYHVIILLHCHFSITVHHLPHPTPHGRRCYRDFLWGHSFSLLFLFFFPFLLLLRASVFYLQKKITFQVKWVRELRRVQTLSEQCAWEFMRELSELRTKVKGILNCWWNVILNLWAGRIISKRFGCN